MTSDSATVAHPNAAGTTNTESTLSTYAPL